MIATRKSWKTQPPAAMTEIPYSASFSDAEYEQIRDGRVPRSGEDRWFAFFEDGTLFIHQASTGFCAFMVAFESTKGSCVATGASTQLDLEGWSHRQLDSVVELVDSLIRGLLLR